MDWNTLNAIADTWAWFMLDRLLSAGILCLIVSAVYFRFRKFISPSMGILLFSLVLVKCVLPYQSHSLFTWDAPTQTEPAISSSNEINISNKKPIHLQPKEVVVEHKVNYTKTNNTSINVAKTEDVSIRQMENKQHPTKKHTIQNHQLTEEQCKPEETRASIAPQPPKPLPRLDDTVSSVDSINTAPDQSSVLQIPTINLPPLSLSFCLMVFWGLGVLGLLLRWVFHEWRAYRLIQSAIPLSKDALPFAWNEIQNKSGVKCDVSLQTAEWVSSPFATGILRPSVFLPLSYQAKYSKQDLQWIILHELAHIRRCDPLMQLLQSVVQTVFFFHPAVWFANRMIYRLREFACDEAAVHGSNSSRTDCGEGLLRVVLHANNQAPQLAGAVNMVHSKQLIKERLMRILHPHPSINKRSQALSVLFILTLLYLLPVGIIQLQAQTDAETTAELLQKDTRIHEPKDLYAKELALKEKTIVKQNERIVRETLAKNRIHEPKDLVEKEKYLKEKAKDLQLTSQLLKEKGIELQQVNVQAIQKEVQKQLEIVQNLLQENELPLHQEETQEHLEEVQIHIEAVQDMLHEFEINYDFDFDHVTPVVHVNANVNTVQAPMPHPNVQAVAQVHTNINIDHNIDNKESVHFNMHIDRDNFFDTNEPGKIRGVWTGKVKDDILSLELTYQFDEGKIEINRTFENYKKKFPYLTILNVDSEDISFGIELTKDAGTFVFSGSFDKGLGSGQYIFEPNPDFTRAYNSLGFGEITNRRQFFYAMHDLKLSFIEYLKNNGYPNLTEDELFEFCIFDVDEEYIEGMKALGFTDLPVKKFIEMKIHGITPEYIGYFRDAGFTGQDANDYIQMKIHGLTPKAYKGYVNAGYTDLDVKELMQLCIHRVSPEYIQNIKDAGYDDIPIQKYVEMKIHNISPDFIKKMADYGFTGLSAQEIINMRIHNVKPELANALVQHGFEKPSANKLAELSIHGINEKYIADLAIVGYNGIPLNKLVEFKIHGVKPEHIKQFTELGYKNIPANQIVEMKIHGVTPEFIKKKNEEAGKQLSIREIINKRIHGR